MTKRKDDRTATPPQPATTEKDIDPDDSAVSDRKASRGDRYADTDAPGAEGNDPSHLAGKTTVRKVSKDA